MSDATLAPVKTSMFNADVLQRLLAFAVLILMIVFFSLTSPVFFGWPTLVNILTATVVNGTLAVACTLVIISGGIDLSVGTMMTLTAIVSGLIIQKAGLPIPFGIAGALACGAFMGGITGFMIAKMKIPPFIATLGMMLMARGLALVSSGAKPVYFSDFPNYALISADASINNILPDWDIPNGVFVMFALAILAAVILSRTIMGRYIHALGSNEEAARLSGMNVDFWKIATYATSGLIAGIAGLLISSRLGTARPDLGFGYELDAIAATVIGGTSLQGGRGSILGTMIGAFIMSLLLHGLRLIDVQEEWKIVVTGLVIVLSVYVDNLLRKKA